MKNYKTVLFGFLLSVSLVVLGCGGGGGGGDTAAPTGPVIVTAQTINSNLLGTWRRSDSYTSGNLIITSEKYNYNSNGTVIGSSTAIEYFTGTTDIKKTYYLTVSGKYTVTDGKINHFNGVIQMYTLNANTGLKEYVPDISVKDNTQLITEISSAKMIQVDQADTKAVTYYKE